MTAMPLRNPTPVGSPSATKLVSEVENLRDATEEVFLDAVEHLSREDTHFSLLRAPLGKLAALAAEGQTAQLRGLAHQVRDRVGNFVSGMRDALDGIGRLWSQASQVQADLSDILRLVRAMNIVALNARVAVAGLGISGAAFGVFTQDVTLLVQEATEMVDGLERVARRLIRSADRSQQSAGGLAATLESTIASAVRDMSQNLLLFEGDLLRLTGKGSDMEARTVALLQATASAVVALQIGDNTRQRLDHIAMILSAGAANHEASPILERLAAAQLADAAAEHAAAIAMARPALLELQRNAEAMLDEGLGPFVEDAGRSQSAGMLHAIVSRIETAMQDTFPVKAALEVEGRQMSADFTALLAAVARSSNMEERMRLIGLNAVIACSRLGAEGLALKEISGQLRDLASDVVRQLASLGTGIEAMGASTDRLITQLSDVARLFDDVPTDRLKGEVDTIIRTTAEAAHAVSETRRARRKGRPFTLDGLDRHSALLTQIAAKSAGRLDGNIVGSPTLLASVASIYTMDAERKVHDAIVSEMAPHDAVRAPVQTPAPSPSQSPADDIFF